MACGQEVLLKESGNPAVPAGLQVYRHLHLDFSGARFSGIYLAWLSEALRGRAVIRVIIGGALTMLITGAVGHLVGLSL